MNGSFHSGFVAIVGRANVGKSTLLNAMLGQKLAIVSPKPHTTRHKLLGVLNGEGFQAALLDTPGFLRRGRDQLDAAMSRQMASALADADLAVLVVEPRPPGDVERLLVDQISASGTPILLALNKIDSVAKRKLLPVIEAYTVLHDFVDIVPLSATEKDGVDVLLRQLAERLPAQEALFAPEVLTDRPVSLLCADMIQEKVFLLYEQEIPYDVAVEIEEYEERAEGQADLVRATIYVDTPSQKRLLIGAGGSALKEVGVQARADIEQLVGGPVYVELWVKVSPKWRRKAGFIQRMV
ncbi:MAG: GTPase Era [Chloroflexi bacterium]|nr:GTPase Era [Chloroflexota bacterium]MCH7654654.1 GTPase Era [Chloroflexota bacterium]